MDDRLSRLFEQHKEPTDESEIIVIGDLLNECPILHDFMRFTKFNGEPCETPRLGYGVSGGKLYVTLSDSARRRSLRIQSISFYDGCVQIENHIMQGSLDTLWFSWGGAHGKSKKKSQG